MSKITHVIHHSTCLSWAALLTMILPFAAPAVAQVADTALLDVRLSIMGATRIDSPDTPPNTEPAPTGTISADLLRHSLSGKARQLLQKAQRTAQSGDHLSAIRLFEEALAKCPESAAWIQPLLGVEYLKTDQFAAAVKSLEQAVLLLPRDAIHRSNFGLSLATVGEYDRAEQELQRAIELDRNNVITRQLLDVVEAERRHRNHE